MLTITVLDIYSFPLSVLHKYTFLRIKTPSVFHEKVRFLNILFISSILPCIKKSVRSVCDPFAQFRMPVSFITIRLIRARIIFLEQSYSFNSFEIYFLKHQDSFNSFNSCSKRQDSCSMHRITCHTCNLCVCARTHPRARMRIFYKVN